MAGKQEQDTTDFNMFVYDGQPALKLDPGVERVREFHEAFDCVITAEPWIPELSPADQSLLTLHAKTLAAQAALLKAQAAEANGTGRTALGLLLIRLQLIVEEAGEVTEALVMGDLPHLLQEMSDLSYVVDGLYVTLGLGQVKVAADAELHGANMSKLGADGRPILSAAGRVEKGPNYRQPDMAKVLLGRPGGT